MYLESEDFSDKGGSNESLNCFLCMYDNNYINPLRRAICFGTYVNREDLVQTPQKATSDQVFTVFPEISMQNTTTKVKTFRRNP